MNYVDLAPFVAVDALGAPQPVIMRKLAEVANEFFRLTRAYEVKLTPAAVAADTKNVTLTLPSDTILCEVTGVRLGSAKLWPRLDRQLEEELGEWETAEGTPKYYRTEANTIRLVPFPVVEEAGPLRASYTVAPTLTATSVADEPGLRYQDALIAGAKAMVLAMPKKEWSDPQLAAIFQAQYQTRLNEVRILVRNGGSSEQQLRVRPRFV